MTSDPAEVKACDDALARDWLLWLRANKGCSTRTVEAYGLAARRLRDFLGPDRSLLQAERAELEGFCGPWLHKQGVVANSRKPYISALKGLYAWLHHRELIKRDIGAEIAHPEAGRPLPHAISLKNAERMMWTPDLGTLLGLRDATIMALLIGCGMRVSGLVGCNQEDVETIEIKGQPRLQIRLLEKGGKGRLVPVPRDAEMLLRVYLDHPELKALDRATTCPRSGRPARVLLVATQPGATPADQWHGERLRMSRQAVWRMIQRRGMRLQIPPEQLHPHAFRHLFGTELAEDDVDLLRRQALMGHADPKSTQIYTHLAARRKFEDVDRAGPLAKMKTPVSEVLKRL